MHRRHFSHLAATLVGALALVLATASPAPAAEGTEPAKVEVGGLTFTAPEPWSVKEEPRTMSAAGLTYPSGQEGIEPLSADFYYFGTGQGGTAEANIQRWEGQFQGTPEVKTETMTFGDKEVTLVQITGTYLQGAMFGPKTAMVDHALLGVIAPGNDAPVFIKMTGAEKSVLRAKDALEKLVASAYE